MRELTLLEPETIEYLTGHLFRCGSYVKILDSVRLARQRPGGTSREESTP